MEGPLTRIFSRCQEGVLSVIAGSKAYVAVTSYHRKVRMRRSLLLIEFRSSLFGRANSAWAASGVTPNNHIGGGCGHPALSLWA